MSNVKIKICGLKREEDISYVNDVLPDYCGFIFAEKSHRYVTPDKAKDLKKILNPSIKSVGVFVNKDISYIMDVVNSGAIDLVQLHGSEDDDYIELLREHTDKEIIKAFKIESKEDIKNALSSKADYLLFDNGNGGTGKTFDWNLISDVTRPYFLAGGLNEENVQSALDRVCPYALDVSSGVEVDKLKNKDKIISFTQIVRNYK